MVHSKLQILHAIVLGGSSYGDSDKIITFFTKEKGKVRGIAKNVKRITSKKRPSLEPFTYLKLQLTKENLGIITEVSPLDHFTEIRLDLTSVSVAYFLCECINKSTADFSPQETIFEILLSALTDLNTGVSRKSVKEKFTKDLLVELGYVAEDHIVSDPTKLLEEIIERKLGSVRIGRMLQ